MIPSIRRKEWRDLVTGSIDPRIQSHSLRIKLSIIKRKVVMGTLSPENAAMELFVECKTHFNIYRHDLHRIFMVENAEAIS
jgi:hypothetical protein